MGTPSYSRDLTACDFHVFGSMKEAFAKRLHPTDEEVYNERGNDYQMLDGNFSARATKNSCHATIIVLISLAIL